MLSIYRLSHLLWRLGVPVLPYLLKALNRILFAVVLPPSTRVGKGVVFSYHGLGTVVHKRAVLEDDVIVGTGVTIGGRSGHETVPTIGAGAMIGSGAKVLGPIRVGRGASIGANAVVLSDVPDYAVVVGIPARVVRIQDSNEVVDYKTFSEARRDADLQ
ncbi:serine O-acetyltransferase [Roseateles violae]|uniref:Serine O-acetyltransferase n=1 Tax=Roseateles violae TaxID=3058042 RepID=A0ABT8DR84_9BURK|nr:serine O-acetyltransferase [Pelomonas sp. PFR6]MDN3920855.1 serine O-acetyltransferase [Pelomonas sp. PFR6]